MNKEVLEGLRELKQGYKSFIKKTSKKNPNVNRELSRLLVRVAATDLKLLGVIEDILKLNAKYEEKACLKSK